MTSFLDHCRHLPETSFSAGDFVIREGLKEDRMFFLKSGSVDVLKNRVVINSIMAPGSLIGEVSALLNRPPLASVQASTHCVFYVTENPQEFLEDTPQIALRIARTLATRLYSVTNHLAEIESKNRSDQFTLRMLTPVMQSLYHHQTTGEDPSESDRVEGIADPSGLPG